MARLRSGVCYRLRCASDEEAATASDDAIAWLVSRNPALKRLTRWTTIEAVAIAAGISPVALLKTVKGDSELSQRMMAALVNLSGESEAVAFPGMFDLVSDGEMAGAAA